MIWTLFKSRYQNNFLLISVMILIWFKYFFRDFPILWMMMMIMIIMMMIMMRICLNFATTFKNN